MNESYISLIQEIDMNKNTEEKVMMLLRTLSDKDNWELQEVRSIINDEFIRNDLMWVKEHYDPMYVAQDLICEIEEK